MEDSDDQNQVVGSIWVCFKKAKGQRVDRNDSSKQTMGTGEDRTGKGQALTQTEENKALVFIHSARVWGCQLHAGTIGAQRTQC